VLALVRRARRRLFHNELLAQGANTSSAALAAFILLLLLGTEILSWQFAVVIPVAALAAGLYIARRRLPSPYVTAQIIDRRLGLSDTLSTAVFFSDPDRSSRTSRQVARLQAETAEQLSRTVDIRRAVPYTMPRTAYAMTALLLVAGSLFALRYGVSKRLDLKQPLATILHQTFGADQPEQAARNKMPKVPRPDAAPDSEMASADDREQRAGDPQDSGSERAEDATEPTPGKSEAKNADGSKKAEDGAQDSQGEQQDESGDERAGNDGDSASAGQQGNKQDSKDGSSKQESSSSGENSSLMSKVKDAVQNLLSRMKPQQQNGGQQQAGEQNSQQGKGQQNGAKQQAKNGQQQSGNQQGDPQDGQAGEQSQNAQDQQGKGTGNSDSKQASKQPGSGVGSQDGEKRLKDAQQLAAMGKISEIIGRRSQTISGETTVEVQSTNQQLRTQYGNRAVQHTQTGAEISRDEIPVALQTYVEQYFEQVRKQPAPAKK
jgi:hypothetical protein